MTSITLLPALIYLVLVTDIKAFINKRKVLWVIFVVVLGLFQYLYLFWRYYDPSSRFLEGRTPDLSSFLFFITGENWKAEMFGFSIWEVITERLPAFFHEIMIDFFYLAFILSIIGIFILRKKKINTFLLLCFAGNFFFCSKLQYC